jgi:hypothetical protein
MRLCERSEAISLAWGPLPGDCRVASLLAKTVKLELPLFKFIKSAAKQSPGNGPPAGPLGLGWLELDVDNHGLRVLAARAAKQERAG